MASWKALSPTLSRVAAAWIVVAVGCSGGADGSTSLSDDTASVGDGWLDDAVGNDGAANDVSGDGAANDVSADGATQDAAQGAETTGTGGTLALKDLAYTPPQGVTSDKATLDLFRVDDGQERPLVLLVHGGTWASGDKAGFAAKIVPWWLERGYVAAPVNFRLASKKGQSPVVKPRDQTQDVAAALAWLMKHADKYKIAKTGVVLMGYSSGAHLVALLGTDETILQAAGVDETQVAAAISLDVHAYDVPYALELMVGSVVAKNIPIIRHLFGTTETEQLQGSPIHFVGGWAAKALVISVDKDPKVQGTHGYIVAKAAQRYVDALVKAGHAAKTLHDINETHSSLVGGYGAPGDPTTAAVKEFIEGL